MAAPALLPAIALVSGAFAGVWLPASWFPPPWLLALPLAAAAAAWLAGWSRLTVATLGLTFALNGAALAANANEAARHTPLRAVLDEAFGGFALESLGPAGEHDPVRTRALIAEDAAARGDFTSLPVVVEEVFVGGAWRAAPGGVTLSVSGRAAPGRANAWTRGRRIEAPVTFRRPTRYLNDGVPDLEADLALDGTTLFGSVKSGLVVEIASRGNLLEEAAARVRAYVRSIVDRYVAARDEVSGAITVAVLIGDRTALPDEIRERLQAAGTYHIIAISGGNIAILAGLSLIALACLGLSTRAAAIATVLVLAAYAGLVSGEPSVWRATLMACLYLGSRILEHRTAPWQTIALAAAIVLCVRPLAVVDVGFVLTFAASAALLECARRAAKSEAFGRVARWLIGAVAVSAAAEIALLPVQAWTFSRVTGAGLLLNLLAVPLMGVVQVAGLVVVLGGWWESLASLAGWTAHAAATLIVDSARLVEWWPWLTTRIPPPSVATVVAYYTGLGIALMCRRWLKAAGVALAATMALAIISGTSQLFASAPSHPSTPAPSHRLIATFFDVNQADSTLLQLPNGRTLLIDAAGSPFSSGGFDIGRRVLAPALWARGVRRLDALVLTHGDPDHVGGAASVASDFRPRVIWEGINPPGHPVFEGLRERWPVVDRRAGESWRDGDVYIRVLHPPAPDWERVEVRNDDSLVLEIVYGEVAILLPGDISGTIERQITPYLTPARIRVLKTAHHGSRTSTSRALVDAWRPTVAIISAGRGNTFGHPHPDVLRRLESAGTAIYRADLHGQITVATDGASLRVETFTGGDDEFR